jgi:hypothetical protein
MKFFNISVYVFSSLDNYFWYTSVFAVNLISIVDFEKLFIPHVL